MQNRFSHTTGSPIESMEDSKADEKRPPPLLLEDGGELEEELAISINREALRRAFSTGVRVGSLSVEEINSKMSEK